MDTEYSQLNLNIPTSLKQTLETLAQAAGTDVTAVVLRALHEHLAEPMIGRDALHQADEVFQNAPQCARCGREAVPSAAMTALCDQPLILVCAPACSHQWVDAHNVPLATGDEVALYPGADGQPVVGDVLSFSVDGYWTPLATVRVPGHRRTYQQNTRKLTSTRQPR